MKHKCFLHNPLFRGTEPGADPDPSIIKYKYYGNHTLLLFTAVLWI